MTQTSHTEKFSFTVPDGHAEAGVKKEGSFTYPQVETVEDAQKVLDDKEMDIVSVVNDILKANARSNAYQNALAPYKPSKVSPEDIRERIIRDFIRSGATEDAARKQVEALLGAL